MVLQEGAGSEAAGLTIARDYVEAFGKVAGTGHVLMLPGGGGPGDVNNMMHFVKAFKSINEARKFLKSKSCLDELLKLELEAGNFIEADLA